MFPPPPTLPARPVPERLRELWERSPFRSSIHLTAAERAELVSLGRAGAAERARPLIAARLGPPEPVNDGRQTPWHGFPSFPAQHATATCCRACLSKHHGIPTGIALGDEHLAYIEVCLMAFWEAELAEERPCDCRRCRQGRTGQRPRPEDGRQPVIPPSTAQPLLLGLEDLDG